VLPVLPEMSSSGTCNSCKELTSEVIGPAVSIGGDILKVRWIDALNLVNSDTGSHSN